MTTFELHHVQQPGRTASTVHRPASIDEALRLLAHDPDRRPIAGGTDLLLDLQRGGPGQPVELIDLTTVADFGVISETDSSLTLGGGVTHNQLLRHPGVIETVTPLAQACLEVGSPQLRNRATIAGNIATASPANDTLSALLALGAELELSRWESGAVKRRSVAIEDFFTGFRQTAMAPTELITAIEVPRLRADQRGIWVKLGNRRAQAISVIHAGFVLTGDGDTVTDARMAFGSVAATVTLAEETGEALIGSPLSDESIARAAASVAAQFQPIDDVRATADYRHSMLGTLVTRSLEALRDDQHTSQWPSVIPTLGGAKAVTPLAARSTVRIDDPISVEVNGDRVEADGAAERTLLDWLRERAGLDGTKEGCAEGECGACAVQLNGTAVMSCLVNAAQADGGTVVTVEGLSSQEGLHPVQKAFIDEFAVQCGFCIPGFLVSCASLLDEVDDPTDDDIRLGLSGNLCRCTGYYPMIQAVKSAAGQPVTVSDTAVPRRRAPRLSPSCSLALITDGSDHSVGSIDDSTNGGKS